MELKAIKMDGLGNDFIIFDNRKNNIVLEKKQLLKIADRNQIGCDQIIFIHEEVHPPSHEIDCPVIYFD